ncbi:MAG: hypothetical protein Q9217_006689 [Psora testacea]
MALNGWQVSELHPVVNVTDDPHSRLDGPGGDNAPNLEADHGHGLAGRCGDTQGPDVRHPQQYEDRDNPDRDREVLLMVEEGLAQDLRHVQTQRRRRDHSDHQDNSLDKEFGDLRQQEPVQGQRARRGGRQADKVDDDQVSLALLYQFFETLQSSVLASLMSER